MASEVVFLSLPVTCNHLEILYSILFSCLVKHFKCAKLSMAILNRTTVIAAIHYSILDNYNFNY
jgi:hypothetical protein